MRADKFFAEKFGSRTKAQEALARGLILRDGVPLSPKDEVREKDHFSFLAAEEHFVSNGGYKLARGLSVFGESVQNCVVADLGASTGGFCDCLLQRGAKHVYCVDVGKSQLDERLAQDGHVTVMDETNARYLTSTSFPEAIDCVTGDLSFISLRLILPAVVDILPEGGRAFVLFKPQFECEGKGIGKSGILPVSRHAALLKSFYRFACDLGLPPQDVVNAPIRPKKNVEYIVFLKKGGTAVKEGVFLQNAQNFDR